MPPPSRGTNIPTHRPSRSIEQGREQSPYRKNLRGQTQTLDIFADPPTTERHRRPRRNSESSVADKSGRFLDPEDERRRKERRYRDKDGKSRGEVRRPQTARTKKPNQRLDLIDQLDVTSIYGTGCKQYRASSTWESQMKILMIIDDQYSIMTDRLMRATLIATAKAPNGRPCRHFPKTRLII